MFSFRLGLAETRQLIALAKEMEASVSDLVREALYTVYKVGELEDQGDCTALCEDSRRTQEGR